MGNRDPLGLYRRNMMPKLVSCVSQVPLATVKVIYCIFAAYTKDGQGRSNA